MHQSPFHWILRYLKYFEQDWVQTAKRCDKLLKLWMQTSNIDQYCNDNDIVNDYFSHITIILIHYKVEEWTSFYRIGPCLACTVQENSPTPVHTFFGPHSLLLTRIYNHHHPHPWQSALQNQHSSSKGQLLRFLSIVFIIFFVLIHVFYFRSQ